MPCGGKAEVCGVQLQPSAHLGQQPSLISLPRSQPSNGGPKCSRSNTHRFHRAPLSNICTPAILPLLLTKDFFFPTKPFLPVYLLHLASFEEESDPVCCLLAPCQYHDTCGLFVQPMTQVQGFSSHVFQHLGQNWQHISDTVLDSRATCITHRQQGNKGRYSHPRLA